jgi:hypothetical protein
MVTRLGVAFGRATQPGFGCKSLRRPGREALGSDLRHRVILGLDTSNSCTAKPRIRKGLVKRGPAMPKSVFTEAYAAAARRIYELRMEHGVSQVELAARLGRPQQFVSAVERRVRRIDIVEFYVVVRAIGGDPLAEITALYRDYRSDLRI